MNECDGKMTLRASGAMAIIVALGLVAPSFASCRYVAFGWELSQLKIPELLSAAEAFDETLSDEETNDFAEGTMRELLESLISEELLFNVP